MRHPQVERKTAGFRWWFQAAPSVFSKPSHRPRTSRKPLLRGAWLQRREQATRHSRISSESLGRGPGAQERRAKRDSISASAASRAARLTGLEVRSESMRSRCKSSSCLCRSTRARSSTFFFAASIKTPEAVRSAADCCSSTDLLSHPRAISLWYDMPLRPTPVPELFALNCRFSLGAVGWRNHESLAKNRSFRSNKSGDLERSQWWIDSYILTRPGGPKKHGNRFTFRQHSNPGCCVILPFPDWTRGYLIEIAGLSKGQ